METKPIVLLAPLQHSSRKENHALLDFEVEFAEFLSTVDAIESHGCIVRSPIPSSALEESVRTPYDAFASRLMASRPDVAVVLPEANQDDTTITAPRDAFQQYGPELFVTPRANKDKDTAVTHALLRALGVSKAPKYNHLGEGGTTQIVGSVALVSQWNYHRAQTLEKIGYTVINVPLVTPIAELQQRDANVGRIDKDIHLGRKPNGSYYLCASQSYAAKQRDALENIKRRFNASVFVAPYNLDTHVNILTLPDGSVVAPEGRTALFLINQLGMDNVIRTSTLPHNSPRSAGVRYRSNLVNPAKLR